ncbi:hypothetical protein [Nitrosomonas sp.]|uniref:hypothetical protein n=1 Tax=Nitrosomonas sp. TaxID=42353 RepID=UPI0025E44F32|nr:hypothetical protein [Nitrosomonas sp.]MBV6447464.1 hypothetical protein [Nitrosomonas sp.]
MSDEERKIIISRVSEYRQNESGEYQRVPVSPVNRWLTYAILIPVVIIMAILGIFFFAAFLALLAVAVVVVGIRFWWLRRKYENTMQQSGEDQTVIIEDAQIIEETDVHRTEQKKH